MEQINRIYKTFFSLDEAMMRLNDFYTAPEVQKGLIKREQQEGLADYALTVQGSFSWGMSSLDKEEKEQLKEKIKKSEEERLDNT